MNKQEQEIIESTKEFAKAHNIYYDQMTENMILNAMREQLLLHNITCLESEIVRKVGVDKKKTIIIRGDKEKEFQRFVEMMKRIIMTREE